MRSSCAIILISSQSFPLSNIDARVKSSLLLNEIEFRPYDKQEILAMRKERASYGIKPHAVDDNLLSMIVGTCNGHARMAL
ncbi:MAG TPA: hypothetical protein VF172_08640 [Nitrososphaera sp.]